MNKFTLLSIAFLLGTSTITCAQNVGIGTNTPTAKLHVVDNGANFTKLLVEGNNTSTLGEIRIRNTVSNNSIAFGYVNNFNALGNPGENYIRVSAPTQGLNIINQNTSGTGGHIGLYAGVTHTSTPTFYLSDNQNVGIGTETPTERLHVVGGGRITSLSGVGNRMVVANANGVLATQAIPSGATGSDDQNLTGATLAGTNLTIAIESGNSATVNLASLRNDADAVIGNEYNTGFTLVGNDLRLTDGGGTRTVDLSSFGTANSRNGLNTVGGFVELGGTLIKSTTVTQANFDMIYDLTGSGDFLIQDNGTTKFTVLSNGTSRFGGDVEWYDNNTGGTLLGTMVDDGDDGRFTVRENGTISVDLDANSRFVFNEQGLDRDFRVESNNNANMLMVNAGTDRVGVNTANPTEELDVNGGGRFRTGVVIGAHNTYGTHLLTVASANSPAMQVGSMGFNQVEAGILTFEENTPNYTVAGGPYCGFQFRHDGTQDKLFLSSGCTANDIRMTWERTGDVGIGTDNPTNMLSVNGAANKTGGGAWAVFSDRRLKKDITNYQEGLSLITKVRTVNFRYNDTMTEIWGEDLRNKNRVYQGVIAQELQTIAPDMVREVNMTDQKSVEEHDYDAENIPEKGDTYLEVDPNKFTYALINAVQEQQVMIEELRKELATVKALLTEKE